MPNIKAYSLILSRTHFGFWIKSACENYRQVVQPWTIKYKIHPSNYLVCGNVYYGWFWYEKLSSNYLSSSHSLYVSPSSVTAMLFSSALSLPVTDNSWWSGWVFDCLGSMGCSHHMMRIYHMMRMSTHQTHWGWLQFSFHAGWWGCGSTRLFCLHRNHDHFALVFFTLEFEKECDL